MHSYPLSSYGIYGDDILALAVEEPRGGGEKSEGEGATSVQYHFRIRAVGPKKLTNMRVQAA